MKTLDEIILRNMRAELNICKAEHSALKASNLPTSLITERMDWLERKIAVQKSKIEEKEAQR